LTQPKEIFLDPTGQKDENISFYKENFSDPEVGDLTRPNPNSKKISQPVSKNFGPGPSLVRMLSLFGALQLGLRIFY